MTDMAAATQCSYYDIIRGVTVAQLFPPWFHFFIFSLYGLGPLVLYSCGYTAGVDMFETPSSLLRFPRHPDDTSVLAVFLSCMLLCAAKHCGCGFMQSCDA